MKIPKSSILIYFCAVLAISIPCAAQAPVDSCEVFRPVTSSYSAEFGSAHIADTYLTPLHYRGEHLGLDYERTQAMKFSPDKWIMQLCLGADFDRVKSPTRNTTMLNGAITGSWSMMRRWQLPANLTLGVGPRVSLDVGVLYLSRNGNNPASAKAAFTVGATGYASWRGKVLGLPFTVRYQPSVPVTGAFFSPDYGELYYQIYLGNTGGLAHAAWWGNYFAMENLLTADLHFGSTSLRVGYRNNILSTKVNNLVTRDITHAVVLGITTEWLSLPATSKSVRGRLIPAY